MKLHLVIFGSLLMLVAPALAQASVTYPGELIQHWSLAAPLPASPPYCTLCHSSDAGGTGTATTPFGRALLRTGTLGNNVPSFDGSLDTLETSGNDSDRDGVADLEELIAGTSPNEGEPLPGSEPDPLANVPLPRTGCSVGVPNGSAGVSAGLAALLLLSLRRVRRSA
ncbi:MAG: hypothetical protein K0R38_6085 [Polyangiaceae bacterium]|jgi:hypothetical protein|nr:hypothetical protein [Polyangiaceae bacterium]